MLRGPTENIGEMFVGERGRNRTFNLLIKSQLLCQLSYAPLRGYSKNSPTEVNTMRRSNMY
jgi:hypothetical protein